MAELLYRGRQRRPGDDRQNALLGACAAATIRSFSAELQTRPKLSDAAVYELNACDFCHPYAARIEYDGEDGIFTGRIAGIRDAVGFHAERVDGPREAFHVAAEDYVETCARIGKQPQKT